MKRHLWGLALAGMLIGLAGCAKDPTASISGTPTRIVPQYSKLFLFPGDSIAVTIEVRDEQGASMSIPATVASDDANIVSVRDEDQPPQAQTRFWARAEGVGGTKIQVAAEGLSNTILVSVFPDVFEGDISVISTAILDTIVVNVGASGLAFLVPAVEGDPRSVVEVDGELTRFVSVTADEMKVISRATNANAAAVVTVRNLVFLPGTEYESTIESLDAANPVAITGEFNEPGNNDPATATPITAGGASKEGLITSTDIDDYFVFTLAAAASVTITVEFDGGGSDPDLDVFLLDAGGGGFCVLDGCAMATGSQPEEFTGTLAAGTYTVLIELYDSGAAVEPLWYRIRVQ